MVNHESKLRVFNYGEHRFSGFLRTVTDYWGAHETPPRMLCYGDDPDTRAKLLVIPAGRFGTGLTRIDVFCHCEAGEGWVAPFDDFREAPDDMLEAILGGSAATSLRQETLEQVERWYASRGLRDLHLQRDGACAKASIEVKDQGKGCIIKLWMRSMPAQPWLLQVQSLTLPMPGRMLSMTPSNSFGPWAAPESILPDGTKVRLADGQAVADDRWAVEPKTVASMMRRLHSPETPDNEKKSIASIIMSAHAISKGSIVACGLGRLFPGKEGPGWPDTKQTPEQAANWANSMASVELEALADPAKEGRLGPAKDMSRKGAQEDQFFVGGEARLVTGAGLPRRLAAFKFARYPCHILDEQGRKVTRESHPNCNFWMGRPHYNGNVSPDQLGRLVWPPSTETDGWMAACDEEHWLINNLWAVARMYGDPVVLEMLEFQAHAWLMSTTTDPRLSTTRPGAARAMGYKCWVPWQLWHVLEDRELARKVKSHLASWLEVMLPMLRAKTQDGWWDVRTNSSLGTGRWVMPWQQALGAYGLWQASKLVGNSVGEMMAVSAAMVVLDSAYWKVGNRWRALYSMCLDDNRRDDAADYSSFGCPLALPVVGAQDPAHRHHEKWQQVIKHGDGRWTCPMTNQEVV